MHCCVICNTSLCFFFFLFFLKFYFLKWHCWRPSQWLTDLNNSCMDHTNLTKLNYTQPILQALSSEGKKVENVLCFWPLKCHLLSSSNHSSKLFYYSSSSLTSVSLFPVQAVIQVTKINIFLKQNTLSVSLQGWQTTVNIPNCVKFYHFDLKILVRKGMR